jgi:hypothetical protein
MSDEPVKPAEAAATFARDPYDYPAPDLTTIFADGVASTNWTHGVVKFYLAKLDPHLGAKELPVQRPVAQIVMPYYGFMQTAAFFQRIVATMLSDGTVKQEDWDHAQSTEASKKRD